MADRLSALKARLATAAETTAGTVRRHGFWLAVPAATLLVVIVAWVVGSTALLRAEEWRIRSGELRATRETADVWRLELVPPTEAEQRVWRESEAAVRERGIDPEDRLGLLQQVAQRAEDLGVAEPMVSFIGSDTLDATAIREVGEAVFEVAPWALAVRFVADYATAASFLGSLPPQVDVHRMRMTARDDGVETELVLLVFADDRS